jgi:hypothetical protein
MSDAPDITITTVGAAEPDRHRFLNRVRSLFNIDGWQLPELSPAQQAKFMADPVNYFMRCESAHADAIWREIERRQRT